MLNPLGIPTVDKAPSQTRQQIQPLVGLAQQQTTPIGADCSTVKTGHNFPPGAVFKSEAGLVTLRHSKSRSPLSRKQLRLQMFMLERTALAYPSREKWRLNASSNTRNRPTPSKCGEVYSVSDTYPSPRVQTNRTQLPRRSCSA